MKLIYALLILLCTATQSVSAQILNLGDEVVVEKIKHSDKQFKLIYIFLQLLPNFHRTISQSSPNGAKQQKHRSVFHLCTRQFRHRPLYRYLQNESTHVFNQSRQEKENDKFLQSDKSHMQVLEKKTWNRHCKNGSI